MSFPSKVSFSLCGYFLFLKTKILGDLFEAKSVLCEIIEAIFLHGLKD